MTQPIADEPQIHELITPLESLSAQEMGQNFDAQPYDNQYWMQQNDMGKQEYAMDAMFPPHLQVPTWHWNFNQELPTAPSSPDFLPIQGTLDASPLDLNTKVVRTVSDGEELVAMGLYDSPAEVQSSSLLFGGGLSGGPPRKRSLKLEEAFELPPTAAEDSDDSVDNENDENIKVEDNEDEEEDESAISEPDDAKFDNMDLPIFQNNLQGQMMDDSGNMAGQSFFFEKDPAVVVASQEQYPYGGMPYITTVPQGLPMHGTGYDWF